MESAGKTGVKTWTQQFQQRQTARRIAQNLRKNRIPGSTSIVPSAAASAPNPAPAR
jgi:hypothetical protein